MIFMPSRHSKSEIATKAFIPWYLGRNPNRNVILLCHTQPLANDFGGHIRSLMERNERHRYVFPALRVDSATHAKDFFRTNQNNAFYAFGINAGVPGRGGDLIDIDDPIPTMEAAHSEQMQHELYETYKGVIKQRLQAHGKILLTTTRWAPRDLAGRILEEEGGSWKVLVLRAQTQLSRCPDPAECDCPYLWEEFLGRKRYEEAKQDTYIWEAMWQQNPRPRLNQGFLEEWLRFWLPKGAKPIYKDDPAGGPPVQIGYPVDHDRLYRYNSYIFVDPAMGKSAAHDRTCILVLVAGPEGRIFLVDAVLERLDAGQRIDHIIRLLRLWRSKQIVYEEYALTADTYFLNLALQAEGIDVLVTSVGRKAGHFSGGRLSKTDRIMQLVPDFQGARIWLPVSLVRTLADGSKIDIINYFINREYLPWAGEGSTEHDDVLDCMSRVRDPMVAFDHAERPDDVDTGEDYGTTGEGSWEARY